MAEKASGVVRKFLADKFYGWVSREGGADVFVPPNIGKVNNLAEGTALEYEFGPDPKKDGKFVVTKVLSKGASAGTQPVHAAPQPAASPPPSTTSPSQEIAVSWRWEDVVNGQFPFIITVKRGEAPALGVPVELVVNGKKVKLPAPTLYPDQSGQVVFFVDLTKVGLNADAESTTIHVVVNKRGYGTRWQKSKTAAVSSAIPTDATPVAAETGRANGIYAYRIMTTPQTAVSTQAMMEVEVRAPNSDPNEGWGPGPLTSDDSGQLVLELRVKEVGARGYVYFCAEGQRSKPEYVVHPQRPQQQPAKPAGAK